MTPRSRVALAIAVATGTLGSTLITAGAFAYSTTPALPAAAQCPAGTVLFRTAPPAPAPTPSPSPTPVQVPQYQAPQYQPTPQYPQYQPQPQYQVPQYQAPQYQGPQYQAPQPQYYSAPQPQAPQSYVPPASTTGASAAYIAQSTLSNVEGSTMAETPVDPATAAATTDVTDPYASASIDPDAFICVVPGYGSAPAPTAPSTPTTPVDPAMPADPAAAPTAEPTPAAEPTPTPTPAVVDPGITGPAPGMIPTSPAQPETPVVPADSDQEPPAAEEPAEDKPSTGQGPNDGGERPSTPQKGDNDSGKGKRITRDEVIGRAVSWVLQQVPYSQTSWWTDSNGTYRQDCSGYVSMAWNLNQRINYWTGNLASVSHRIATKSLKPGDILLLPRSHVVIFAGWANSAKTKFHLYEEYSRGKPARYLTGADLSYYLNRGYGAYRYDKIADVQRGKPGPQSTVYNNAMHTTGTVVDPVLDAALDPALDPTADLNDGMVDIAAQVPGQEWTPAAAAEAESEAERTAPPAHDEQITPDPVPNLPVTTLIDVQLATDMRALAPDELPSVKSASGMVLLAAGVALFFLGFPLAAAARAGVFLPGVPMRREDLA
ncbi:hypothetical protein GCM10009547_27570 [Sporichthya brevicatena]|uniref:NlpC/P60 domain-containing protein n=1 Tax=Sporichthya brevicatena TaxID=171442 RepID=A0ABN1GXU7_9ACTN